MLYTSPYYLENLQKTLFTMIKQIGPPTIFVTFTFAKIFWDPLIKALHTLHAKKLNLPNKIEDLQSINISQMINNDPITCARYYDHKTSCFHTLFNKNPFFWDKCVISFLSHNLKITVVSMTMAFYGLKMHQYMELIQMKKFKFLLINAFHAIYCYCQLHYKMHNNINTFKTCKEKITLYVDSITPYLP
jgi:hypothetical protein